NVVIPYTRVGVIGGVMLALGRALGETMAVTFIIGNSFRISSSIFAPGTTISAAIASEFAESDGLHQSALMLLGLLLFVLTFMVLTAARLMLLRLEKKAGEEHEPDLQIAPPQGHHRSLAMLRRGFVRCDLAGADPDHVVLQRRQG